MAVQGLPSAAVDAVLLVAAVAVVTLAAIAVVGVRRAVRARRAAHEAKSVAGEPSLHDATPASAAAVEAV